MLGHVSLIFTCEGWLSLVFSLLRRLFLRVWSWRALNLTSEVCKCWFFVEARPLAWCLWVYPLSNEACDSRCSLSFLQTWAWALLAMLMLLWSSNVSASLGQYLYLQTCSLWSFGSFVVVDGPWLYELCFEDEHLLVLPLIKDSSMSCSSLAVKLLTAREWARLRRVDATVSLYY